MHSYRNQFIREWYAGQIAPALIALPDGDIPLEDADFTPDEKDIWRKNSKNGSWSAIRDPAYKDYWGPPHRLETTLHRRIAREAVRYADALIAELDAMDQQPSKTGDQKP